MTDYSFSLLGIIIIATGILYELNKIQSELYHIRKAIIGLHKA